MKLLLLNWLDRENPQAGGAELHLHETFGRLARGGWDVTAVTSGWAGAARETKLDGITVHRVGRRYSYLFQAPRKARQLLASQAFDLVVEDLNKAPLFTPLWAGLPTVLLVHHLFGATVFREAGLPLATVTWLFERPIPLVYRRIPVVAVSESTRADLISRGFDPARVRVVENGVDLEKFVPHPDADRYTEPTVLYIGRLRAYKRVDLLLGAVARLKDDGFPVRLLVAGAGDRRRALEKQAGSLGLGAEAVRLLGFVPEDEKVRLLQRAWVHALASEKEGWGISNIEAAACGTPTVATDAPGLRDSVLHERTGLLVPPGDIDALARGLRRLLEDAELRGRLGREARVFAETFSWDRTTERLRQTLEGAVASERPGR